MIRLESRSKRTVAWCAPILTAIKHLNTRKRIIHKYDIRSFSSFWSHAVDVIQLWVHDTRKPRICIFEERKETFCISYLSCAKKGKWHRAISEERDQRRGDIKFQPEETIFQREPSKMGENRSSHYTAHGTNCSSYCGYQFARHFARDTKLRV